MNQLLQPIRQFLACETPDEWVEAARRPENLQVLLQDHCTCELKAAQSAALLIRKYAIDKQSGSVLLSWLKPYEDFVYRKMGDGRFGGSKNELVGELKIKTQNPEKDQINQQILNKMVRLIKEELHHFEQVLALMTERGLPYLSLSAARYASGLIRHVRNHEPAALVDKLIIGAFIEARSCERFAKLAPYMDSQLSRFYLSLLRSEARHYQDYLKLAEMIAANEPQMDADISERIGFFAKLEAGLITSDDDEFRFHSGKPAKIYA